MTEPAPEYTQDQIEEKARLDLGKNLLKALVENIQQLERPWPAMTKDQQDAVIERLAKAVNLNVRGAISLLVTENFAAVPGKVESVTFKDGVKAVIKCSKHIATVHDLADREGDSILMVITDPSHFLESMDEVEGEDNQSSLDLPGEEDIPRDPADNNENQQEDKTDGTGPEAKQQK